MVDSAHLDDVLTWLYAVNLELGPAGVRMTKRIC